MEHITLLNLTGQHEQAMQELDAHKFHPWEGGEGKVPAQYQLARVELAKKALKATLPDGSSSAKATETDKPSVAVGLLEQCLVYPHHLGLFAFQSFIG